MHSNGDAHPFNDVEVYFNLLLTLREGVYLDPVVIGV